MGILFAPSLDALPAPLVERLTFRDGIGFFQSIDWFRCMVSARVFGDAPLSILYSAGLDWALVLHADCHGCAVSFANYYSPEYGLSGRTHGIEEDGLAEAIMALAGASGCARFRGLKAGMPAADTLIDLFRSRRFRSGLDAQYVNWFQNIVFASASDYFEQRPSRLRSTIRRGRNKLSRRHRLRMEVVDGCCADLERRISQFNDIYRLSWKPPENHPELVPALIRTCARLGILRLGSLLVDNIPAASQLWIADGTTAHIYKKAPAPRTSRAREG